jgi:hypothetical protein
MADAGGALYFDKIRAPRLYHLLFLLPLLVVLGGAINSGTIHSSSVRSSWLRDIRRGPRVKRPSMSHASAIMTAPVVVIVNETV